MTFSKASRFGDDHDVVLVGYRGVDGVRRCRSFRARLGFDSSRG